MKLMHCFPALRDRAVLGEELFRRTGLQGLAETGDVFESPSSIDFDHAGNRKHSIKAVMVAARAG